MNLLATFNQISASMRNKIPATSDEIKQYELLDEKIAYFMQNSGFKREELEVIEFLKRGERDIKRVVIFKDKVPIFNIEIREKAMVIEDKEEPLEDRDVLKCDKKLLNYNEI